LTGYNDRFTFHCMNTKAQIISSAERVFDQYGFAGTGMDVLTQVANVSSRTLYKHVGSKSALIVAVLNERATRYFNQTDVDNIDALFISLQEWVQTQGSQGCLFLRAMGEISGENPEVAEAVGHYRSRLYSLIEKIITKEIGRPPTELLTEQILVLLEGAISVVSYHGSKAISAAHVAAAALIIQAR
jgi:AcrR family transcriptional regulator